MDRIDRRQFLALASLLSLSGLTMGPLISGFGGGNSNGSTELTDTRGTVALPAGFTLPLSELTAQTGLGGGALTSAPGFTVRTTSTNWTLSWIQHASERLVLMGFVDPSRTDNVIDSASTAVALLYFVLGGYQIPENRKGTLIQILQAAPETASLAVVIAQRTALNPFALEDGDAEIGAALKDSYNQLIGGTRAAVLAAKRGRAEEIPTQLLIEPSGEHSGVEVLQGDKDRTLFATNHYHRRCQVRIYEVGTQDGESLPSYYDTAKPVGLTISLPSTGSLGIFSTVTELFGKGNLAFEPISTAPVTLTPNPNVSKTLFEVVVLGSAFTDQEPTFFNDALYSNEVALWRSVRQGLNIASWLADIIFGIFLEIWGLRDLTKEDAAIYAAIEAFQSIELQSVKSLLLKAGQGKIPEATAELLQMAAKNDLALQRCREALRPIIQEAAEQVTKEQATLSLKIFLKMFLNAANIAVSF